MQTSLLWLASPYSLHGFPSVVDLLSVAGLSGVAGVPVPCACLLSVAGFPVNTDVLDVLAFMMASTLDIRPYTCTVAKNRDRQKSITKFIKTVVILTSL